MLWYPGSVRVVDAKLVFKVRLGLSCKNKYCHKVLKFSQGLIKFSCAVSVGICFVVFCFDSALKCTNDLTFKSRTRNQQFACEGIATMKYWKETRFKPMAF